MYISNDINDGVLGGLYSKNDDRLKAWVKRRGLQKEFSRRRAHLEVEDKLNKGESWVRGMESLLTDYGEADGMLNIDGDGNLIDPEVVETGSGKVASDLHGELLDRSAFTSTDEHTNYVKSILWVADNVQIKDVEASDAPSVFAWSMMQMIRKSMKAKENFYFTLIPKVLSSVDPEGDEKNIFDDLDVKTYGRIGRIVDECGVMDQVEYALFSGGIKGKS